MFSGLERSSTVRRRNIITIETGPFKDSVGLFFTILEGKFMMPILLCPLQKMRQRVII